MRRWFERGGWIIALAALIFFAFCTFARVYLGSDSDVNVPLYDWDLLTFTVYADDTEPPPDETQSPETGDASSEPADNDGPLDEAPDEDTYTEENSAQDDEGAADSEPDKQEESEQETQEPEYDEDSDIGGDTPPDDEPVEFDGDFDDYKRETEDETTENTYQADSETLFEIRDLLNVLVTVVLLCIAGFIAYIILKPLWWFIFY